METTLVRYGRYVQQLNRGGMLSLQSVISDESTTCFTKTSETNTYIGYMFDAQYYTNNEINQGEFQAKFQIMGYSLMDQMEACGVNNILMILDSALESIPGAVSTAANTATQLALGWSEFTSAGSDFTSASYQPTVAFYKGLKQLEEANLMADDETATTTSTMKVAQIGQALGLLISQALKYEAPSASVEVNPTSS